MKMAMGGWTKNTVDGYSWARHKQVPMDAVAVLEKFSWGCRIHKYNLNNNIHKFKHNNMKLM